MIPTGNKQKKKYFDLCIITCYVTKLYVINASTTLRNGETESMDPLQAVLLDTYTAVTDTGVMYPQMLLVILLPYQAPQSYYLPVTTSSLACKTSEGGLASFSTIKCSADP